ncbi:hypothetical protein B9G55_02300 [Saccharibacillus sp. O16]|nr:hypothetical protein B9G55_02300 [Saccharibacillus sp. O16]
MQKNNDALLIGKLVWVIGSDGLFECKDLGVNRKKQSGFLKVRARDRKENSHYWTKRSKASIRYIIHTQTFKQPGSTVLKSKKGMQIKA